MFTNFKDLLSLKNNTFSLFSLLILAVLLRLQFLLTKAGDLFLPTLGGDACHHYNLAYNISSGIGPKTNFIFSYWFLHPSIPALTDLYPPGFHFFSAFFFLLFNDSYFTARIIVFFFSILSIFLAYLIGKKIHSENVGFIAAFFISFNLHHIENSTIFFRDNFNLLMMQLFFLNFFYLKNRMSFFLIGFIVGYSSITFGGWQILIIIMTLYFCYNLKKNNYFFSIKLIFFFLLGFLPIFVAWSIVTKNYFGSFYYSNFNYYPIVEDWKLMMHSRETPNFKVFILETDTLNYLYKIFFSSLYNLYRFSISLIPRVLLPFFFVLIPISIYGAIKLKSIGKIFLVFIILYYIIIILASNAFLGKLANRHFIIFLSAIPFIFAVGLVEVLKVFENRIFFVKKIKNFNFTKLVICSIFYILTSFLITKNIGIYANIIPQYNFGERISKITNQNDVIFYGFTPQDAWCATKRNIVVDPIFNSNKLFSDSGRKKRLKEEIDFYNVNYLWIDLSKSVYIRNNRNLQEVLRDYKSLKLKLVIKDEINNHYLYKIIK
jgi:hypothetical protein